MTSARATLLKPETEFEISLSNFQGTIFLLYEWVRSGEVVASELCLREVVLQYLRYLKETREFDLGEVSEFLVYVASLMRIKVSALLPKLNLGEEFPEEEEEIVDENAHQERLVLYKKFKFAASVLAHLAKKQEKIYTRPATFAFDDVPAEFLRKELISSVSLDQLADSFKRYLSRFKIREARTIEDERVSLRDKMAGVLWLLRGKRGPVSVSLLWEKQQTRLELITAFLAILELHRTGYLLIEASDDEVLVTLRGGADGARYEDKGGTRSSAAR